MRFSLALTLLLFLVACTTSVVNDPPVEDGPFGEILVDANVQGASVFVDGVPAGETPILVERAPGEQMVVVTIEAEGYAPYAHDTFVRQDSLVVVNVTLEPLS